MKHDDTIVALSSGSLPSGVAVVRVSGSLCEQISLDFLGQAPEPRHALLSDIVDPGDGSLIDRGLVMVFPSPNSFTGESIIEFHVHGGRAVIDRLLDALTAVQGVRLADAGEFSRRALANGKLGLTEVEAISDLVVAETEAQRKQALNQAGGKLGELCDQWRMRLIRARAMVEAELDFSEEEDVPDEISSTGRLEIESIREEIEQHLSIDMGGEIVRDGFRVALLGKPNVGKSSLLNALAKREVAIVTDEAGTTRDILSVELNVGGFKVIFSDTAGIRDASSQAEIEGVRRAKDIGKGADFAIWLHELGDQDETRPTDLPNVMVLISKDDDGSLSGKKSVSSKTGHGLSSLLELIESELRSAVGNPGNAYITRTRHRDALKRTLDGIAQALAVERSGAELVAEHLRHASDELGRITGRVDTEDLLDVIFSEFCIGK